MAPENLFEFAEQQIPEFREVLATDGLEAALLRLRKRGVSMAQSVFVVKTVLAMSLPDADAVVLNSEAWEDARAGTIAMRESLIDTLESWDGVTEGGDT